MNNEIDMLRKNVFDNLQAIEEKDKQLDKYKNVIDKIKEYIDEDEWTSVNGVITAKLIKNKINELLEEVE